MTLCQVLGQTWRIYPLGDNRLQYRCARTYRPLRRRVLRHNTLCFHRSSSTSLGIHGFGPLLFKVQTKWARSNPRGTSFVSSVEFPLVNPRRIPCHYEGRSTITVKARELSWHRHPLCKTKRQVALVLILRSSVTFTVYYAAGLTFTGSGVHVAHA